MAADARPFAAGDADRLLVLSVGDAFDGVGFTLAGFVDAADAGVCALVTSGGVDVTVGGAIGAAGGSDESAAGGPLVTRFDAEPDPGADADAGAPDADAGTVAVDLLSGFMAPVLVAAGFAAPAFIAPALVASGLVRPAFVAPALIAPAFLALGLAEPRRAASVAFASRDEPFVDAVGAVGALGLRGAGEAAPRDGRASAFLPVVALVVTRPFARAFALVFAVSRGASAGFARRVAVAGGSLGTAASFDAVVATAAGAVDGVERSEV